MCRHLYIEVSLMTGVYVPKSYDSAPFNKVIFLAGPIAWGGDWQLEAARHILAHSSDIDVALPLRQLPPDLSDRKIDGAEVADRQLEWEQKMIEIAAAKGALLFWLPKNSDFPIPHDGPARAYARDTRVELGAWMTEAKYRKEVRVIIAGEEGFDGLDIIKRNAIEKMDLSTNSFPSNLREACDLAVAQACSR